MPHSIFVCLSGTRNIHALHHLLMSALYLNVAFGCHVIEQKLAWIALASWGMQAGDQ